MKLNSLLPSALFATLSLLLVSFADKAAAAVGITGAGVTVTFPLAPSGEDFASVSVAGFTGDMTDLPTMDTMVPSSLAWPAVPTNWNAPANSIAVEPTASALNAQVRYAVGTQRMLTGPTGNRYHALLGRFVNNAGGAIESLTLTWNLTTPLDPAGTGGVGSDPLAGLHVYYSTTGLLNSWTRLDGPHGSDATVGPSLITIPARIPSGGNLFIAWVDDNGPASGTAPNLEGHFTVDDIVISNVTVATVSLAPVVSNVVRDNNGTPANPADDKINFLLTVGGTGNVGTGWTVTSPASFAASGAYNGIAVPVTGVPIAEFAAGAHTLMGTVQDNQNASATATFAVTAPWCVITPVISNVTRNDQGTADPFDDTWGFTVTVNGQFGSGGWTSTHSDIPGGTYGAVVNVSGRPIAVTADGIGFVDNSDASCIAEVTVSAPRVIGTVSFGSAEPLFSDGDGVPPAWVVDESTVTQIMINGGGAPAKVYRSEVLDLTAIGIVQFSGELAVNDSSSGNEADDTFDARLVFNGDPGNFVSLIAPYDTLVPANGLLTGAEITPATVGPPPTTGPGTFLHTFAAIIPASVNSVQLVIAGNNNSFSETMNLQNIRFELAAHSILAMLAGATFDNKGTVSAADDDFRQNVNITGVSPPPGSTGWNSNLLPAAGLYSELNPVSFGPFDLTVPARELTLFDNNVPGVSTTVSIPSPVPAITATAVAGSVVRNDNGPGPADDTLTAQFAISAAVGGPSFVLETYPGGASVPSAAMNATPQTFTVTMTGIPEHGNLFLTIRDASYPTSQFRFTIAVPPVVVTQYVVAQKNLGGGLSDVLTPAAAVLPAEWSNYPSVPALQMNNSVNIGAVVTSEVVDLSGVNGPVNFTANLRATDLTTGAEVLDYFKAELILDGNTANPVNLIAAYDLDGDGVMAGAELVPVPPVAPSIQVFNYPMSFVIPDNVLNVQLVVTAANDSANEIVLFEEALFVAGGVPPIVPGNGSLALNVGASGKISAASLVALATGGGGPLTISGVQAGPTVRGGTVTLQDGWLVYEPAAGFSGLDAFTYSITDGTRTVSGTVTVVVATQGGPSFNIIGIVPEGGGVRVAGAGIPGRSYTWEFSPDLQVWTPLGPPAVCPANGIMSVLDPGPELPPVRFYRLVEVGAPQ